jgi:YHS domain-containing protein
LIGIKLQAGVCARLSVRPANHGYQFRYLFPLIGLVAACDRVFDAMGQVVSEHFFLDAPKRGPDRQDLGDNIDAIAVLVDHFGQAANLALDPAQAFSTGRLDVFSHDVYIPLQGMGCKRPAENATIKQEEANPDGASIGSGCCCSSKTPAAPSMETAKAGGCGGGHDRSGHGHHDHQTDGKASLRDPVCGMTVDPATSKHRFDHRGEAFHFCSAGCRTKFAAEPAQYLDKSKVKAAVPKGTIYTCPMHPQIRQIGPGSCPICGMALEPEVASLDTRPNPELADMTRRFWIGLVLSLPPVVLEMGGHLVGGMAGSIRPCRTGFSLCSPPLS